MQVEQINKEDADELMLRLRVSAEDYPIYIIGNSSESCNRVTGINQQGLFASDLDQLPKIIFPIGKELNLMPEGRAEEPLGQKVRAAVFISNHGAGFAGIKTKSCLMWPLTEFTDAQVQREASSLLSSVHTALLATLPPQAIQKISTDQADRLSFVS
jgi:hypothetical protein